MAAAAGTGGLPAAPPALAYHKIGTAELGGTWCTARMLERHLAALASGGWRCIPTAEFEARLAVPAPTRREVLLTFDDAFDSFGRFAWPLLERRRTPVVLFVVTDYVGKRSTWDLPLPGRRVTHLDWRALGDLARAGVEIGSHTATHRDLRRLSDADLAVELGGARAVLEDRLGVEVRAVAYPFGRADARVQAAAAAAGYRLGFGMGPHPGGGPWLLPRHGVYVIDGPGSVLDKVDPSRPLHHWQLLVERGIRAVAGLAALRAARADPAASGAGGRSAPAPGARSG